MENIENQTAIKKLFSITKNTFATNQGIAVNSDPKANNLKPFKTEDSIIKKEVNKPMSTENNKKAPGATVIAEEAVFDGNINAKGDIEVMGTVTGNITTLGSIKILGKVKGDINCDSFELCTDSLVGNITCKANVIVNVGTEYNGNISAYNIICDGKITGDMSARNAIVLKKNANVVGNIKAASLEIENGVILNGTIEIVHNKENAKERIIKTEIPDIAKDN